MKKIYLLFLLIISLQACMKEPDTEPNNNEGNFNALWKIIDTRYCYLDYKNINWDSVHTVYAPRAKAAKSKYELFDVFGAMLAELKDGHVNLYSSFDRSRYWKWYTDYPANFDWNIIKSPRYIGENYRIAGALRYGKIAGGKVGYIYYGDFSSGFSDANISEIFSQFSDCKGLIVDVRNNGGGLITYAETLASYFFKEKTITGYIQHKTGNGHSDFSEPLAVYTNPHAKLKWERPVIILTNRLSYSATNDFACKMQYAPNAKLIGDKTGGGGGLPFSSELPNGWMVRFSTSPVLNAEKQHIEWGITPDIEVNMSKTNADKGIDDIIETAVSEILK